MQVKDEGDVYDVVDEREYSEIVRRRQADDWIVDDGMPPYFVSKHAIHMLL